MTLKEQIGLLKREHRRTWTASCNGQFAVAAQALVEEENVPLGRSPFLLLESHKQSQP
jgi:hypothetical protein